MASGDVYRKIGFDASGAISELKRLTNALRQASGAMSAFDRSTRGFRGAKLTGGLQNATGMMVQFSNGSKSAVTDLNSLVNAAKAAQSGLKPVGNALGEGSKQAGGFANALNKLVTKVQTILSTRAVIAVIGGITKAFRDSAQKAKEFQLAIAEIQTIGGSLNQTSTQLTENILAISSALGSDATTTATGLYQVLSNQVVEAGESFYFLEQAQKLAITTAATTAESVDSLSSIMNAYQLDVAETSRVMDVLFEGVNVGRFKLEDIADIIGRVTPITAQMGITYQEVTAAIAAMTQSGVRADTAITQLRAVTTKLLKPTEALQALYAKWGVKDGPTAIATFGGLAGVLDKIRQETGNSVPELSELFNEVRGLAGAMGLGIDNGQKFADVLDQVSNSAGAAQKAFEGFEASQVQQLVIATEQWNASLVKVGTALIPLRTALTKFGADFAANFAKGLDVLFLSAVERIAKEAEQRNTEISKKAIEERKEFTKLSEDEYKKDKEAALQAAAETTAGFNRIFAGTQIKFKSSTGAYKAYLDGILDAYKSSFKGLEDYVDNINKKLKDSGDKLKDDQQALADEKFKQELDKTSDGAAKQKKILDEAYKQYWEGRTKIMKAGLSEEAKEEAREQLKRSEALYKQAQGGSFAGYNAQADAGVLKAIEARRDGEDKYRKSLQNSLKTGTASLNKFKANAEQIKNLTGALKDKSDELSQAFLDGDKEKAEAVRKDMVALEGQLKKLGFTASEIDLLKQFGPNTAQQFNSQIQKGLDGATYNWLSAITSLRDQLEKTTFKFNASPEVTKALGGKSAEDVFGAADVLGVKYDKGATSATGLLPDVIKAGEDLQKKAAEDIENYRQAEKEITGGVETYLQTVDKFDRASLQDTLKDKAGFLGRAAVGLARIFGDDQISEGVLLKIIGDPNEILPEYDRFSLQLEDIFKGLQNDILPEKGALERIKEDIKNTTSLGEEQTKSLNSQADLIQTIASARERQVEAEKNVLENQEQYRAGIATGEEFGDPLENAALRKGLDEILNGVEASKKKVNELKTGVEQVGTEAGTAGTNVRGIGDAATQANVPVTQTALLFRSMKVDSQATLKAVKDINKEMGGEEGAAPAAAGGSFAGGYFARGGLGSLRMMPRGVDTIPAMIKRGEFVMNDKSSRMFFSELNAMNQGLKPAYRREGGQVTQVGDVNVTVHGGDTSRQTVRAIAAELNRELKRGTIRLGSLRKA